MVLLHNYLILHIYMHIVRSPTRRVLYLRNNGFDGLSLSYISSILDLQIYLYMYDDGYRPPHWSLGFIDHNWISFMYSQRIEFESCL